MKTKPFIFLPEFSKAFSVNVKPNELTEIRPIYKQGGHYHSLH